MSINIPIYSNSNSSSRSVAFDFVGDILVADDAPGNASGVDYYFKISAVGTQDNNAAFPIKIVRSLSSLALNKKNQSALNSGSTSPYSNIKSMVIDYTWDYINGHAANAYGSGCTLQRPMKF